VSEYGRLYCPKARLIIGQDGHFDLLQEKPMVEKVSVAEAKAKLSALLGEVAYGKKRFIIERRGKPLAALVNVEDLEHLEKAQSIAARPLGALALLGAWREMEDSEIDSLVEEIYASREKDLGRPVELED
jgi:prevent-host-death family protein